MGFVVCLFSKPGQTWLCPCTLRCQDSPLQTLEIKVVFSYQCWGLALVWGAGASPSRAQVAEEAESRQSLMWAKPAQPQPQGNSVRQLLAPALAADLSCPLAGVRAAARCLIAALLT